jgi:hypothetical protein
MASSRESINTDKARWYEDQEGFWLALRTKDRATAAQVASQVEEGWEATVGKKRKRRSLDANAYAWVLLDKLSAAMSKSKVDLYRGYIRDVGGVSETVCVVNAAVDKLRAGWEHNGLGWQTETLPSKIEECTNVILYYGSSVYDTGQMARLIDLIVQDCKAVGIETGDPAEIQSLLESWDGK